MAKRIAVVGATGTIGAAVASALEARGDEVIRISRRSGTEIDIESSESVRKGLSAIGEVDAIVSTAGRGAFGKLSEATDEEFGLAVTSKLLGQVNLVRHGAATVKAGGAIVLTSGILGRAPWPGTSSVAMVNGGLESFAKAAALDLPEIRVQVVSPPLVKETAVAMGMADAPAPSAAEVAETYLASIDAGTSGETRFVEGYAV